MELTPSTGISIESTLRGIVGIGFLLLLAYVFSTNKKAINWRVVGIGLFAQIFIGVGVIKIDLISYLFEIVGSFFVNILEYTGAGTYMLLGDLGKTETTGFVFAFQALPVIIFFSALTSIGYYYGIIQKIVRFLAWCLTKVFNLSGSESLSIGGNIFLGQTEAPLLIKAYLEKMNRSEIFLVMVGGMATVAGSVLGAYIALLGGDSPVERLFFAKSLIAASVMAAPGAIVISKMIYPQTQEINCSLSVSYSKIGENFLSAISKGTNEGVRMAINVAAMLLVFIALIALLNGILGAIGDFGINSLIAENTPYSKLSVEFILGSIFAPLMWIIGVSQTDIMLMGQLLGVKLAASEFIAFPQLVDLKNAGNALHFSYEKSVVMATYMLCGFANFASIGIQVGGIGVIAPKIKPILIELGLKAMIAGTLVSLLSATIAGMIIG
ncbi:MAG: Na+ dependent nucleoside transporter [Flavobacteriaceae bacterium]|nr:Na+ dependent nucleoside transporter [Flavobacteriaceae bacterium]|tara:strand:+ start:18908 stop:20224 length:1317 start_codon:yes stop_codon:yes gene_type:complete